MANTKEEYPVHKCVFEDDISTLLTLMRTHDCATKDKQGTLQFKKKKFSLFSIALISIFCSLGNTPLHLAVMLGRKGNVFF